MSPQATLVEFIATSASFHGVRRQSLQALEDELFRVFRDNIMPANAAAWYMAKRRFYNKGPQNELLAMLLKEYPKKFAIMNNVVQFLESYTPAVSSEIVPSPRDILFFIPDFFVYIRFFKFL